MRTYLKIKIKSLADEARIIRAEEGKVLRAHRAHADRKGVARTAPPAVYWGLRDHRMKDVRSESRAACLAYACVRGVPYAALERDPKTAPDVDRVAVLVGRYGAPEHRTRYLPGNKRDSSAAKAHVQAWMAGTLEELVREAA